MRALQIVLAIAVVGFGLPALAIDDDDKAKTETKATDFEKDFEKSDADTSKDVDKETVHTQKMNIDKMADSSMKELFSTSERAKELYDSAYGYAVFDVMKVAIGITGGSGEGVAVCKRAMDDKIYMKMATGGIGIGLGGQKYKTIFMFETQKAFDEFVFDGWEGDAEANAAAGNEGANAASSFSNGVAIYQITEKGLLANVDVSGTKYWIDEDLNHPDLVHEGHTDKDDERTD
jgi:lipid-binding SYLF domain-containing protein